MAIGDDGRFFPQPLDLDLDRLVDADQRFSPVPLSRALVLVFSLHFRLSLALPPKTKCESQTGI